MTTQMPIQRLRFSDPECRQDPWSFYRRFRDVGPVIRIKIPVMGKCWAATTYDAVSTCLKDTEHFVRDPRNAGRKNIIPFQWVVPRSLMSLANNMLGADHQDHRRLRALVDQAFARRNIEGMSERVNELAQQQIEVVSSVLAAEGQVDLIEHYARPLPLSVICELLGLPAEDRPKFTRWFAPFTKIKSIWGIFSLGRGMRKVIKYLRYQFEEVRRNPREGIMSELVNAQSEGDQLSDDELLSMVFLLLVAGHETTVHLISNAVLTLSQFPDAKSDLISDWSKSDAVIEESLRYCSPLQMAKPRFVVQDMEFFGQQLKRREMIMPMLASANYDPARFENPDQFDINRESNYHLSFGSGPHVCLGMKLARTETHFALKNLFERLPNLQPVSLTPDWSSRLGTRGLNSLLFKPVGSSAKINLTSP